MKKPDRRSIAVSAAAGLILSLAVNTGYSASKTGELAVKKPALWISIAAVWVLTAAALCFILNFAETADEKAILRERKKLPHPAITWLIIFICWIPVFLAEYPGFFVYDATDEYIEAATRTFTTHHPLLHVLLLGGSVCAGNKFAGSFNAGIAAYILAQMVFVSGVFAWTLHECTGQHGRPTEAPADRAETMGRTGYVLSLLWYGLFPTVVMFALCSAKDTLFAAFLMAAVVLTARILGSRSTAAADHVLLGISLVLMMLMRNNGVYAFVIYAGAVAVYELSGLLRSKKENGGSDKCSIRKAVIFMMVTLVSAFILYRGCDAALIAVTHASDTENQEILTVPIQQLARTWNVYKDEFTEEETETLGEILSPETLSHYTPELSDPVKADFDNEAYAADKGRYISLWWELFKKHPMSYVNAWIDTSYGYYYPGTVVNVYEGHEVYTFTYDESSYFGYEVEQPGTRTSLIPAIDRFYRWLSLDDDIQRIPVVSFFFSMGGMFVIYLLCTAVMIYRKDAGTVTALILPWAVWLTLLAGPTFLPRYTVFMWFLLPFVLHRTISGMRIPRKERQ